MNTKFLYICAFWCALAPVAETSKDFEIARQSSNSPNFTTKTSMASVSMIQQVTQESTGTTHTQSLSIEHIQSEYAQYIDNIFGMIKEDNSLIPKLEIFLNNTNQWLKLECSASHISDKVYEQILQYGKKRADSLANTMISELTSLDQKKESV